jgi:hypothetical protein
MEKQEHTLTLRIPKDVLRKLRKAAQDNYCSVSDVARDILSSKLVDLVEGDHEHVFASEETWSRAIKTRDAFRCIQCGSTRDLMVMMLVPPPEGGMHTLSNGLTMCFTCYQEQCSDGHHAENGNSVYERLPQSWIRKYRQSREQGRTFWERHLACFLTRRKRPLSPIVEWYAETFLRDVPEEVLIRTLVELCPSPDIIAEFPSRRYTSPNETFQPPPLVWR